MTVPPHPPVSEESAAAVAAAIGPAPLPLVYLGHDLRAALLEMRTGLHLIASLDLPPDTQLALGHCVAAGEALTRLLDQSVLVCLGRGEPGTTAPVLVDVEDWLASLSLRFQGLARQSAHRFELNAMADVPKRLLLDRTAADRVLTNLVVNAFQHTPPGRVNVTISRSDTNPALWFKVTDDGPGFDADQLRQATDDLSPVVSEQHPEHGLGLHSVRYLVKALGGSCHFGNRPDGGAEVRFTLPFTEAPSAPDAPRTLGHNLALSGLRTLLVDDSATCRSAVAATLRHLGVQPIALSNGAQALDHLRAEPRFDLLVLDDQMPDLTGLEVLDWIATHLPQNRRPAVVLTSSYLHPDRVQALLDAGAHQVLLKPAHDPAVLAKALQTALTLAAHSVKAREPSAEADPLITLRRLADLAGEEAAAELFARLLEDLDAAKQGLAGAVARRDIAMIRAQSHILIALAGTAGVMDLHDDAVQLNGLAHSEAASERTLALARRMDQAIGDLVDLVARMSIAQTSTPSLRQGTSP